MSDEETTPPRRIAPGDIVAGYSDELGEWTAAQVTHIDPGSRTAGVVHLDWSGTEPFSINDLGPLEPLRLTHHAHSGQFSHCNYGWLLPRSCKVIGTAPLLVEQPSSAYSTGWQLGLQLDLQRRWDAGDRGSASPGRTTVTGAEFTALLEAPDGIWSLTVQDVVELDCRDLVRLFPTLTSLRLSGSLGTLANSDSLNELGRLRRLSINNLFGMTAADCPRPDALPRLDALYLHSVPAEYASAVRKAWTSEVAHGTDLEVSSPRKSEWLADNRDNPLREWDGRDHISSARYKKALGHYRTTRTAVVGALSDGGDAERLAAIGRDYGEAFNRLDGSGNSFIETEEREELFEALDATVDFAESRLGRAFPQAREGLVAGLDAVRNW